MNDLLVNLNKQPNLNAIAYADDLVIIVKESRQAKLEKKFDEWSRN